MGNGLRELQHCNTATKCGAQKNFLKKVDKTFVNRNENVVTLQAEFGVIGVLALASIPVG